MGKAMRKPRPSMPRWYWLGQDGCWFCHNRRNCNNCGVLGRDAKEMLPKKYKGRHDEPDQDWDSWDGDGNDREEWNPNE